MNRSDQKSPQPPRWADWLLEAFGHPDTREEVQGDLLELYMYWVHTMGQQRANWRYRLSVLKLLRPLARRKQISAYSAPFSLSPDMIRNYLKIAFRNLLKQKVYSGFNLVGLALGISCGLLLTLHIKEEA